MTRQILNTPFFMGPEETDKACLLVHGFSNDYSSSDGIRGFSDTGPCRILFGRVLVIRRNSFYWL